MADVPNNNNIPIVCLVKYNKLAEDQKCGGDVYTFKLGDGCDGWGGITLADCEAHCTGDNIASNCSSAPLGACAGFRYYTESGWCHLFESCEPKNATMIEECGTSACDDYQKEGGTLTKL